MSGQDERITAAAKAIADAWESACHPRLRTEDMIATWREEASKLAPLALAAADEAEAREVAALTAECERLRAAIRDILDESEPEGCNRPELDDALRSASVLIAESPRDKNQGSWLVSESVPAAQEEQ